MENLTNILNALFDEQLQSYKWDGTHLDADGRHVCDICGEYRDHWFAGELFPERILVPCACQCVIRQAEADSKQAKDQALRDWIRESRAIGLPAVRMRESTFAADACPDSRESQAARTYVNNWPQMRADNVGMIFCGCTGTGKSYYAYCVANALIDKGISAGVTSIPDVLRSTSGYNGDKLIDRLVNYDLLILDDLGAERDTSYSRETLFNLIDRRYQTNKPLIVTTNLTLSQIDKPDSIDLLRPYERITEMCPLRFNFTGKNYRHAISHRRQAAIDQFKRDLLRGKER